MGIHALTAGYFDAIAGMEKLLGCRIFIVGGYVRDSILKKESRDIDFCVEGDGIGVARALHERSGGVLTVHKKFLTATLKPKDGVTLDFATARTETYPAPAAMPAVKPATLRDDLRRRDFTINAIAIPLSEASRPKIPDALIDPCGGYRDIKSGIVRVMHEKSFTDDPTRVLRAVRYAVRFGFCIESRTMELLRRAVGQDLLGLVSAPRLRDEFTKALEEDKAKKIFTEFEEMGILKHFGDNFDISELSPSAETPEIRLKKLLGNYTPAEKNAFVKKFCLPVGIAG